MRILKLVALIALGILMLFLLSGLVLVYFAPVPNQYDSFMLRAINNNLILNNFLVGSLLFGMLLMSLRRN